MVKIFNNEEQVNIVITGHVDHGKSTVIGRMLADTRSLPEGKLKMVQEYCRKNSKAFEYAFLLDALKEEQSQGITIDAARIFFKTKKRRYIILDAPGHVEFIRNMITGASKAEAALIVIDANEGIQENSTRHGYLVSMLGIKQVSVLINKMDLVDYSRDVYNQVVEEYSSFLEKLGIKADSYIPIMAQEGDNIVTTSDNMSWYSGQTVIGQIDSFKLVETAKDKSFRLPVQDIYKFTDKRDARRIIAGRVTSGTLKPGDEVMFSPSNKTSKVKSIEIFAKGSVDSVEAGYNCGVVIEDPLYIKPGEIMWKKGDHDPPLVNWLFKVNIFWMSNFPMIKKKQYVAKLGTAKILVKISSILNIIDASELTSIANKEQIDKYDVAECILEVNKPIAFDPAKEFDVSGRFVIIDNYEISGAATVIDNGDDDQLSIDKHIKERENSWDFGYVRVKEREYRNSHKSKFVLIVGENTNWNTDLGKSLEKKLFHNNYSAYYLGNKSITAGLETDLESNSIEDREEKIRRMGELAKIMTDAGHIFITTIDEIDDYELQKLKLLNEPNEILVINIGEKNFNKYSVDLDIKGEATQEDIIAKVMEFLKQKAIFMEYYL